MKTETTVMKSKALFSDDGEHRLLLRRLPRCTDVPGDQSSRDSNGYQNGCYRSGYRSFCR